MAYEHLHGTGVALVTPFKKDKSVDFEGLQRLLHSTAEKGVNYYVVNGTTAESATTTVAEKQEILQFVKEQNTHKLPIVFGLGGNNTQNIIDQLSDFDLNGVDAILSVSPAYNKPSQSGIIAHFEHIADKSPAPIILYNVPGRTSSNMLSSTTLKLAQHPNIIGVKESSGSIEQVMEILSERPQDFMVVSGEDMLTTAIYAYGGNGVISVLANAFSDVFSRIYKATLTNDYASARKAAFKLLKIHPLMYKESNPVGVKYVLEKMQICESYVRLPLIEASEWLKSEIDSVFENSAF